MATDTATLKNLIEKYSDPGWRKALSKLTIVTPNDQDDAKNSTFDREKRDQEKRDFFMPELVQERSKLTKLPYGGFFYPVTPENRDAVIATLFADDEDKGQWLINYLEHGENKTMVDKLFGKEKFTDQQKAFIKAYDRFMVGFLDTTPPSDKITGKKDLTSYRYTAMLADETITDKEMLEMVIRYRFAEDPDAEKKMPTGYTSDTEMAAMGEPLASRWFIFTGGVMQGTADYESDKLRGPRYVPSELEGLYSPAAIETLKVNNQGSIPSPTGKKGLAAWLETMEETCGTDDQRVFTPPPNEIYSGRGK